MIIAVWLTGDLTATACIVAGLRLVLMYAAYRRERPYRLAVAQGLRPVIRCPYPPPGTCCVCGMDNLVVPAVAHDGCAEWVDRQMPGCGLALGMAPSL